MSCFFFFKQMTAYEMRISDWSSDVCSSDLPRAAKVEALAYTAGAIVTALLLGGALLALRAAGEQVGWAFQLQHPVSVLALLILSLAITLNLLGTYELPSFGGGQAVAGKGGAAGGFRSGEGRVGKGGVSVDLGGRRIIKKKKHKKIHKE